MNAQKRRMRELAHKKEIERLWQEKLAIYRTQRDLEWEERRIKKEREDLEKQIIQDQKDALLRQHADILQ